MEITDFCRSCGATVIRIHSPYGNWWAHETHPKDEHDAVAPTPDEDWDDE